MEDKEFTDKLIHLARRFGHSGDYVEVIEFVEWCCEELDLDKPTVEELEPYPDES